MARKRRDKRPRLPQPEPDVSAIPEIEPGADNVEETQLLIRRRVALKGKVALKERIIDDNEQISDLPSPEWCEDNISFCCAVCRCHDKREGDDQYIVPTNDSLAHRKCCHGAADSDMEWVPLFQEAITRGSDICLSNKEKLRDPACLEWVTKKAIHDAYKTSRSQESALYNADADLTALAMLKTHSDYDDAIEKPFEQLCAAIEKGEKSRHGAVVLDCFAGVGTGIVVLKRLGIAIRKIIHVEYDLVASHVYRSNHDRAYNETLPDDGGIEHVYEYKRWEDLNEKEAMEDLLRKHGPIDFIVGGPPCVDYSKVNAFREGASGDQGQYMIQFGGFIRKLERLQHNHPVFFLAENVRLQDQDREAVRDAFGFDWDPIQLDALYVSPTRRDRMFLTNVPYQDIDYNCELSHVGPRDCLEEGFCVPAHVLDPNVTAKAQCLMGSKARIDEPNSLRMYVFNQTPDNMNRYHGRPMKVVERESLMGYQKGYVETPVRELFYHLQNDALAKMLEGESWRDSLCEKYHHFAGNYHGLPVKNPYRFDVVKDGDWCKVELLMAPPVAKNSSTPSFFDAEEYAKHLIGMAYSVPVVEHLLRPLQRVFESRNYEGYDYNYAWERNEVGS